MSFSGALIPSTTYTTTGNTATIAGITDIRGAIFIVNVTAISMGATFQITMQVFDIASGLYIDIVGFPAIATASTIKPIVYPSASGAIYQVLPADYRLKWTISGGESPSVTFSIGVNYLN